MTTSPMETMDAAECAALLRCSVDQVEELARLGDIPGLKLGRGWLFVRADLLAYLAEQAREQAAQRRAQTKKPANIVPVPRVTQRRRQPPPLPVPLPVPAR